MCHYIKKVKHITTIEISNHSEIWIIFNLKINQKEMCHYNIKEVTNFLTLRFEPMKFRNFHHGLYIKL